ncbi:MAG TPA: porin [Thermodesulfobacteriota bacterium]|nr:porin [Thermodesulfobacteriota bacterium]
MGRNAWAALFMLVMTCLFWSPASKAAADDRLERLEQEVQELKKENSEIKKRMGDVETEGEETRHSLGLLSKLVDVSGYADAEFIFTGQEDERNRFRIRHLSLFFTKDIQKEWKLFTEIEFEDAPRIESNPASDTVKKSQGTLFVEQMYIEYHPATNWDVRAGRYLTPAGIWSIYHYPPYVPTQTSPLFYKVIFPEVSDGILLRNSFSVFDSALDTHLFVANGSDNPGSTDRNQNKAVGARVNLGIMNGLSLGASFYGEKDNQDIRRSSYGAHLLYGYGNFRLQTEFAFRHNNTSGGIDDRGLYAQLSYDIKSWEIAGRADWYDKNDKVSKDAHYRYTGALNYHFAHNVVGKIEYDRNEFDDPAIKDYNEVIMAIVVAIGDL